MRTSVFAAAISIALICVIPQPAYAVEPQALTIEGARASAQDSAPVTLDANFFLPETVPAPAVVIAHGFGGDKNGGTSQAEKLVDAGFAVLTYSARGFGESTGKISVNSPDFEVADAGKIIDYLATRSEVIQDATGDPRVGFTGGSYGGALSLLIAGYDNRVDALASDITWNDLRTSLFGQSIQQDQELGAYKDLWTGYFFSVGLTNPDGSVTNCGRFSETWCRAYTESASSAELTPENAQLMLASSPISITDQINVPALISGGQSDSLFPLAQTNANAQQIMAAHPNNPVSVIWHGMGHDGGIDENDRLDSLITQWFVKYLSQKTSDSAVPAPFEVTLPSGAISTQNTRPDATVLTGISYPGLFGSAQEVIPVAGPPQRILSPAGASPASITSLPGLGGSIAGNLGSFISSGFPGQSAYFQSAPVEARTQIIGSSQISVALASDFPVKDAVFFASLQIVAPNGRATLPQGLVAPIRLDTLTSTPTEVSVDLPAIAVELNAGDSLRVVISTTDMAYRMPVDQRIYSVALTSGAVTVPLVSGLQASASGTSLLWLLIVIPIVFAVWLALYFIRPRGETVTQSPELAHLPVRIEGVSKKYKGGYQAVSDLSFDVPPGVVLGLLGPNGAGKTTTMRMLMGLIAPTEGRIHIFGEPVYFGAPVLQKVGALVEGAGFLPHLSGRQNLELYWRATGQTGESYLDEVLEIADLGTAIDRKVKAYSQGMRQRLGIAQAMLGKPSVLVLDEPTNGLDPPQIKAMRDVMKDYAASGRTVIVSSHMLSEVEQTCSHVVVMHRGKLIAVGEVETLLAGRADGRLEDIFLDMIGEDLTVGKE